MDIKSLKPEFDFGKHNEDVILTAEEPAELIIRDGKITANGKGVLSLGRKASISFKIPILNINDLGIALKAVGVESKLRLVKHNIEIDGAIFSSSVSTRGLSILSWSSLHEPFCVYGDENTELDYITFHLLNGVDFFSNNSLTEELNGESWGIWFTLLKWDNWEVCIKSTKDTRDNIELLKSNGGYTLTHIGMINKTDSSIFKAEDFQKLKRGLSFFLSFAVGRTCWANLCVGYKNDQKVYEEWGAVTSLWSSIGTWWHRTSSAQARSAILEEFFPLFMAVWSNKNWQSALCEAIHWYLNSNDTSKLMLEPSLILQQAAIERLAFEYAVNDKKLISSEGFKKLIASDKYRLLFSSLGLPLPIPPELKSLLSIAKLRHWEDVPHALTEIRNSIVHPEHKQKGNFSEALHDAWLLSLECLELSILGICGYKGQYQSRVKTKQISVPWN